MEIEVVNDKKGIFEFRILDKDPGLAELIVERLNEDKDVSFAAYKWEHPLAGYPLIVVKSKDPKASLKKAIKSIVKELKGIEKVLE